METISEQPIFFRQFLRDDLQEYWVTSTPQNEDSKGLFNALARLGELSAVPTFIRLFGSKKALEKGLSIINSRSESIPSPLLVQAPDPGNTESLRFQIYAVPSECVTPIDQDGRHIGWVYEDDWARYAAMTLLPGEHAHSGYEQAADVFNRMHEVLLSLGHGFENGFRKVFRTWLFANDILSWYDQLNKARNEFFTKHDIFNHLVPASTGIGAANYHGRAMAVQALAAVELNPDTVIAPGKSPLQCPALDYKSSFSRAMKILTPDHERLYISGTASIDEHGNTVNLGDTPAQIELTMKVVEAILDHAGMDFANTVTAITYFKHPRDYHLFDEYCSEKALNLPHIKLHADVCRDDLLFEIELDAVKRS